MKRKVFFVHGLGVKKDARGMFTDIEKSFSEDEELKDIECVFTDLNIIKKDGDGKEKLILNPLSVQAEILKNVYREILPPGLAGGELGSGEAILICHSQGCVVAAIADLKNITKTIFIAPPTKNDIERSVDRFKVRPGTVIDIDSDSFVTRSDGSTTIIPKEYWEDRKDIDYMETYRNFAEKNKLEIIFGTEDEIVLLENDRDMETFGNIHRIPGDHNFSGDTRTGLLSKIREIII